MHATAGISEQIIQDIVGCGKFQVILSLCVHFLANLSAVFTMLFMSFGNFNPGWKCLQQNSTVNINGAVFNVMYNETSRNVSINSCREFELCEHVEFDPDSSTIVSEWGLICRKKWIPSLMISVQMAGVLVGTVFTGYCCDAIGRKVTLYSSLFLMTCINSLSVLSFSWEMFAALRFFGGVFGSCVTSYHFMFTAEFLRKDWRSVLQGIPSWGVSTILFGVTCMLCRDWRRVHVVTVALGIVGLIPAVWVPESLRWLEVKNKTQEFERVAKKIARMNGKTLPCLEGLGPTVNQEQGDGKSVKIYNIFHLFNKEVRGYTILLAWPWFTESLVFYALGFGVKAMYGDFYLNLIISGSVDIPFSILPMVLPNILGRKMSNLIFVAMTALCLVGASCVDRFASDNERAIGIVVLVYTGKVAVGALWCVTIMCTLELYPTVVRGLGISWGYGVSRIGGVIAPFLIPDDVDNVFIPYLTMGVLLLACSWFLVRLPETKGKPLKETFDSE